MSEDWTFPTVAEFDAYETGLMSTDEVVNFFQRLVDFGVIGQLQGHYQRQLRSLVQAELVHLPPKG